VIIWGLIIEVPETNADYSELDIYYYTLDHVGRPMSLRDKDRNLRWYENHYPFGEVINEDTPNGPMTAGLGAYAVTWKPNTRFPGQYQSSDMHPFVQNHFREYMPELGRYARLDPLQARRGKKCQRDDKYTYSVNNPVNKSDFYGLFSYPDDSCAPEQKEKIRTAGGIVTTYLDRACRENCENLNSCCEELKKLGYSTWQQRKQLADKIFFMQLRCISTKAYCGDANQIPVKLSFNAIDGIGCGCLQSTLFHEGLELEGKNHDYQGAYYKAEAECFPCYRSSGKK
jgi:RHS repeat-associated protein